jgi:hypothetical protein
VKVLRCLRQLGFVATYSKTDERFTMSGKAVSHQTMGLDLGKCEKLAGYPMVDEFTLAQKVYLYGRTVETRTCLIRAGYSMPPMPSKSSFVATYQKTPYLPYAYLPQLTASQLLAVEKKCPQPDL